ncbi:MAG: hypothetical protein OEY37_06680 [Gammaproteobacteria bacterium]|nr:hypothetical protein [Gammaproteobacteria bacterium]MDH5617114.1 hypothetical protein [Gammaproteobacteria bacterium]
MTTERDPLLMALFAQAESSLDDNAFAEDVMRMIDRQRRRTMLLWSAGMLVAIACIALLAAPVITAMTMATELLPASLVSIETGWLQQLLAPVNSVAAALALGILVLRKFYRRLFR